MKFNYDVIVVGAGHAGCEAAAASANMGAKTCLITIDMNKIAHMSCNPAIGGIAKGQIIREVDALGGYTGLVTDKSSLQFRMLNKSKGPAMWSPRAQCDQVKFSYTWRHFLENIPNLTIWQDQVKEIIVDHNEIIGVKTWWDVEFYAKSVIITTGTFLNGLMHIGRNMLGGGRCAEPSETNLTLSIANYGINYNRMKTGTPIRIDKRSVHFEDMIEQEIDHDCVHQFSYLEARDYELPQIPCWEVYTNKECHDILRSGLNDSPLYNGQIKSIGPRYCPSIETKLHTFPDKDKHPMFLEPTTKDSNEMYLNGFSSSLPIDIQLNALKKIPAFRDVTLYRPGYAIEYDFFDPTQLKHTLESKIISGLFFAGQVNGTTGYEEAAGQGIIAGINAALHCTSNKEFVLGREDAYIGVLIDDLVLKGVDEPYRMFTSRAEYRILLRQDNADERLTKKSHDIGLASNERYQHWLFKKSIIDKAKNYITTKKLNIDEIHNYCHNAQITEPLTLEKILKRADLNNFPFELYILHEHEFMKTLNIHNIDNYMGKNESHTFFEALDSVNIQTKYQSYIDREKKQVEKNNKLSFVVIPDNFDFNSIKQLTIEAREKLNKHMPKTIAEASRIPGISPNDINILLILLRQ